MSRHALRRLEHLIFDVQTSDPRHTFIAGKLTKSVPRIEATTMVCHVCKARGAWEPPHRGPTQDADALAARATCRAFLEHHWRCGKPIEPMPPHFDTEPSA